MTVSEAVATHRTDYWEWVSTHGDASIRDNLIVLRDHWRDVNRQYFGGVMQEPYITLTEPSAPTIYGQCCSMSSWGSRLEIRLRPSLVNGTHPHLRGSCPQFVKDVLLHEAVHQHVMEHEPGVNEESYHGHGPVFTAHANRIGAALGLPEVVVRNRGGKKLPKSAQWPHCVAPPERYDGLYRPRRTVTAKRVVVPEGCEPACVSHVDGTTLIDIDFDSPKGDKSIGLRIDLDTAWQLADFIMQFVAGDE